MADPVSNDNDASARSHPTGPFRGLVSPLPPRQRGQDYFSDATAHPRQTSSAAPIANASTLSARPGPHHTPSVASPSLGEREYASLFSPRTPTGGSRLSSSAFNSPGSSFVAGDDVFVLEIGARHLNIGMGGERLPRCCVTFGPDEQRRPSDYSAWLPSRECASNRSKHSPRLKSFRRWGHDHELFQVDTRNLDLGLVVDKIERAVRKAAVEHLLVLDDQKRRYLVLSVDPMLPYPLLSAICHTLFNQYPIPTSISLYPTSVMCAVAAGLRAALVVDVGWGETVVTAVSEVREVHSCRSSRGMKRLSWHIAQLLNEELDRKQGESLSQPSPPGRTSITLEEAEEVMIRMAWCPHNVRSESPSSSDATNLISVSLSSHSELSPLSLPFQRFSEPVNATFFPYADGDRHDQNASEELTTCTTSSSLRKGNLDDDEEPLPSLIHRALLHLPPDVRSNVYEHFILVGGGSNIPGLRPRLVDEVSRVLEWRGWDPVKSYGKADGKVEPMPSRRHMKNVATTGGKMGRSDSDGDHEVPIPTNKDVDEDSATPAHEQPQLPDPYMERIHHRQNARPSSKKWRNTGEEPDSRTLDPRTVKSLGAWAGASLVAGLRVRSMVEVEREEFVGHMERFERSSGSKSGT